MKGFRTTVLLAFCLVLTRCFDLNQTLTINEDRTLRYKGELAVPSLLVRMTEAQSGEDFACDKDFELVTNTGAEIEVKDAERSGNRLCLYIIETELQDEIEIALKAAGEEEAEPLMVMRRLEGGRYRVSSDFTSLTAYTDESEIGEAYNSAAKAVMETLFEDRAVRWVLNAPNVVNSNGDISEDGTSVSWEASLSELVDTDENMAFVAEIEVPQTILGRVRSFFSGFTGMFGGEEPSEQVSEESDSQGEPGEGPAPTEDDSESLLDRQVD